MAWSVHVSSNIKALDVYIKGGGGGGGLYTPPRSAAFGCTGCIDVISTLPFTSDLNLLLYVEGTGNLLS